MTICELIDEFSEGLQATVDIQNIIKEKITTAQIQNKSAYMNQLVQIAVTIEDMKKELIDYFKSDVARRQIL